MPGLASYTVIIFSMEYKRVITQMAYTPVNDPHASQIKHIQHSPILTE